MAEMNPVDKHRNKQVSLAFLSGGGEMGRLMRAHDWSATPLGPVVDWPQSLKTAVRIILGSRYPMFIWWGRELINLYNDGYLPMLGQRHPAALGKSAALIWSEIWDTIGPQTDAVLQEGRATWNEERLLVLERNGYPEEAYFTFSYSPISADEGGIGGIFCALTEDTQRVLSQRRMRTLRELSAKTMGARTVEQACQATTETLAHNPHDLPFALIYLLDSESKIARLAGRTGLGDGLAAYPEAISPMSSNGQSACWPLDRVAATGRAELVKALETRCGRLRCGVWPDPPQAAIVLPIMQSGQDRLAGFLVAGISPRCVFDDDYRGFTELLTGHIATAITNARAYEEEKKRAEALAELDRAKTAFFSNVSHEFRTPLTLMLGPVEDLLARSHTDLPPAAASQLELVNRNGLRLLRLVNTLLDFSRIEAGRVRATYQPTDLAIFTSDLASVFRSACERAGLRLLVDCPKLTEQVYVDREMWEKVVLNLLSNAFKFTFEGEIEVSLRQVGNAVRLVVRDTGTGVPAEEMPRLFERFHRIQNARGRTHEGSGIGLALVQELVRLHGGSIAAESAVGKGTAFSVCVPLGSAHLPPDQIGEARNLVSTATGASPYVEEALRWLPDHQGEGEDRSELPAYQEPLPTPYRLRDQGEVDDRPRVLVADDNADMRQYVARLLAEQFQVEIVADGEAALAAARKRPPDLILSDVMMPRLDGFGLLREIRADPRLSSLPVILLSARAGEESRVEGMEAGADDYLVKPFGARELLARVTAHLQMACMRREANESLRQSEERLRMALTAARMVAWQWNPIVDKVVFSDNASDVFGLRPDAMPENSYQWFALIHPSDVGQHRAKVVRGVEECGSYMSQFRMIRQDNQAVIWLEERGHGVGNGSGKAVQLIGVVMDITDRKLAEEALKEADRRKNEFLATLSHELRNPLAPIRNGLQVMKLARSDVSAVEQARAMMERQLRHMARLVDDLMDMSRISQGRVELRKERVELAKVVQQAVETSRPMIEEMDHELKLDVPTVPIFVNADLTRLAQVFANLLNNAAKYTERSGRITLRVERQESEALVSVRDTGVGIPAHMLPRVFEMFTQVDQSLERSQGGLGIGLSLVKGFVEMHGGSIEARSDGHGMGSEFVVRLPVALSVIGHQPSAQLAKTSTTAKTRRRILVTDDNRDSAVSLAMLLRLMGNETQTAHDGLEALDVGAMFRPDVVLLDIGMPKLNGYDTARRIREQPWGRNVVLIALTGWGKEEDRRCSHEAGFSLHMVKPVDPAALEKVLAELKLETA